MNISQHVSALIFTAIIRWFDNTEVKKMHSLQSFMTSKKQIYKITN
jgi:hypothetical protein